MDPYDKFGDEPIIVTGTGPVLLRSIYSKPAVSPANTPSEGPSAGDSESE
jgi:hypothetical protein